MGSTRGFTVGPLTWAGLVFVAIGAVEFAIGWLIGNPALLAIGSHDLVGDGLALSVIGLLDDRLARAKRHWASCIFRKVLNLVPPLLGLALGMTAVLHIEPEIASGPGAAVAIATSVVSFAANLKFHRLLHSRGDAHHHGASLELMADAFGAPIAVGGTLAAIYWGSPAWIVRAAWAILAITAVFSAWALYKGLRLLAQHCDMSAHDH